jgi:hypothetical protein
MSFDLPLTAAGSFMCFYFDSDLISHKKGLRNKTEEWLRGGYVHVLYEGQTFK